MNLLTRPKQHKMTPCTCNQIKAANQEITVINQKRETQSTTNQTN